MTIYEVIDNLKKIAKTQPLIGSSGEGDIYEFMNADPSVKYATFFITQNQHTETEMFDNYNLTLFYIDRLTDNEDNRVEIQSIGKEVLSNVIRTFKEVFDAESETIQYQPFTQRFNDYCAGIFASISIEVEKNTTCTDADYGYVIENIKIKNQEKSITITENGKTVIVPDADYTGLERVEIDVNVPFELNLDFVGMGDEESFPVNTKRQEYFEQDMLYSKEKYDEWDPATTNVWNKYRDDRKLIYAPKIDTSAVTYAENMFYGCKNLFYVPKLDTSKVYNMYGMFLNCESLQEIPLFDTSNVVNMGACFAGCKSLKTIPLLDTSKVDSLYNCFAGCTNLTTVPKLDTSSVTDIENCFSNCPSLTYIPQLDASKWKKTSFIFYKSPNIKSIGGFVDLKTSTSISNLDLDKQSLLNIIYCLGNADPEFSEGKPNLYMGEINKGKLTDEEIKIATNKGWKIYF